MYREYLDNIRKLFVEYQKLRPDNPMWKIPIILCDKLEGEHDYPSINELNNICNILLSTIPVEYYKTQEYIVDNLSMLMLGLMAKFEENEKITLFVDVVYTLSKHAQMLAMLGLVGDSYNYSIRAISLFGKKQGNSLIEIDISKWDRAMELGIEGTRETLLDIVTNYFYISRNLGHNYEDCHYLYKCTIKFVILGNNSTDIDVNYICFYAGILAANPYDVAVVQSVLDILKQQYSIELTRNEQLASRIAETLSTRFGEIAGEPIEVWAQNALAVSDDAIHPQSKISLNLTVLLHDEILNKENIELNIIAFLEYLEGNGAKVEKSKLTNFLQRQRLSELIIRTVVIAILRKEYEFAIRCAYLWRTYESYEAFQMPNEGEAILLVIPTIDIRNALYILYHKGNAKFISGASTANLLELLKSKNAFEGTWTVLLNQQEPIENVDGRNIPSVKDSESYKDTLVNYFAPEEVAKEFEQLPNGTNIRVLELSWSNMPVISLLGLYTERGISSLISNTLFNEAKIKKVLIWCDPDPTEPLFDAHLELEAIEFLLRQSNIKYDLYVGDECTLDKFLEVYSSEEYDVIYLMCHGAFDPDDPPNSSLLVASKKLIRLRDLVRKTPNRTSRRLVILNACQSGSSGVRYDAMGFVGMGQALTTSSQSVMGNLWSVDSYAASVMGVLFMIHLLKEESWAKALNESRKDMYKGNEYISELFIAELSSEVQIVNSVASRGERLNKLIYWAAPLLFE